MISLPKKNTPYIAPSLLSADFSRLAEEIAAVERAGADLLHVDVMDGHFVPNITIGPLIVEAMKKCATAPLDVHLMITEPDKFIGAFKRAGAGILTVHVETCPHLHRTVQFIHEQEMLAGVSINPATPVSVLENILPYIDLVLIMSVNPGFGGQQFIRDAVKKVLRLREMIEKGQKTVLIEIDGGISTDNAKNVFEAGADILVAGSAIFHSSDYTQYIDALRSVCGAK